MAKSDLYHKVSIDSVLKDLTQLKGETGYIEFKTGAKDSLIEKFEQEHDIKLPDDYKAFLRVTDGGMIFGLEFHGLSELEKHTLEFSDDAGRDRRYEQVYPIANENGNPISINLQAPRGAKNPNRRDILDTFHENGETIVIAKSFGEFLWRMVQGSKKVVDQVEFEGESFPVDGSMYWCDPNFQPIREYFEATLSGPSYDI